jgi:hypothetical protein
MFKSKYKLTLGTDPEVASVIKKGGKNLVVSPALLEKFSGLKNIPDGRPEDEQTKHPFYFKNDKYIWMMDGVAWEATIKPAKTPTELYDRIQDSLFFLEEKLMKLSYENDPLILYKRPVVDIEPDMYLPHLNEEKILQGFIFGCDPDEDAINPDYVCEEIDVTKHLFRYLGGHFHVGSEDSEIVELMQEVYMPFLRLLAIFVGNVTIAYSKYPEEEKQRAETYGQAGRFRFQKWGLEYRSPSVSWISNLDTTRMMFQGAEKAVYFLKNPQLGMNVINKFLEPTIQAIKNGDSEASKSIIQEVF